MNTADLYYAVPCSTFQLRRDLSLSLTSGNELLPLDDVASRVFNACSGFRTLDEHASAAWQTGAATHPDVLRTAFARLLESGLLRKADAPAAAGAADVATGVTAIAFVTADRPRMLARGLRSAIEHVERFGHRPRFIVIDGSQRLREATRNVAGEVSRTTECAVEYVDRAAARSLVERIHGMGAAARSIEAAVTPGAIGSSRNLALLLTAGERALMIDDDILCDTWLPPAVSPEIRLAGHTDVRQWRFFESRESALAAAQRAPLDLLEAHSGLLGRSLDCVIDCSVDPDLGGACGHMVSALTGQSGGTVRVTMAGLAGDAARYCAYRLLFLNGSLREIFRRDPSALAQALAHREVHSIVTRPTVVHDPVCASYCMGVANDRLLPPFMPIGRGEDAVFGALLAFADTSALFAHLPCGVIHDSERPSDYGADAMPSAAQTRISEFLLMMLGRAAHLAGEDAMPDRLRWFADDLRRLGEMTRKAFITFVTTQQLQARCSQLLALETALERIPHCPIQMLTAVDAYRQAFGRHATEPAFYLPIEFRAAGTLEEGFGAMQTFLSQFGNLIRLWPDVWHAAAAAKLERPL